MNSVSRENGSAQGNPVYTVYPAGNPWNMNHGSYQSSAHAPPPKYEDVINGRQSEYTTHSEAIGAREGPQQAGVVLVTPIYKYSKTQQIVGLTFSIVFVITLVSFLVKFLRF